jgi:hypothetical protein
MKEYIYAVLENETEIVKAIAEFDDFNTMDGLIYPEEWSTFIPIKEKDIEIGMRYNIDTNTFQ